MKLSTTKSSDEEAEGNGFFEVVEVDAVSLEEETKSLCFHLECLVSPRHYLQTFSQTLHLKPD